MLETPVSRRAALARLGAAAMLLVAAPLEAAADWRGRGVRHPDPRPGITARDVLDPADVPERVRDAYEAARAIPQVLDGLYCHCDCAARDNLRSLLSCFETRMPANCGICAGEARQAYQLARQGRSLGSIRKAIDARFG